MIETLGNVALNQPDRSPPLVVNLSERGMASTSRAETVRVIAELPIEVGIQNHPNYFSKKLVAPSGQPQRAFATILFGNVSPSGWFPVIAFRPQGFNDRYVRKSRNRGYGFVVSNTNAFSPRVKCLPLGNFAT